MKKIVESIREKMKLKEIDIQLISICAISAAVCILIGKCISSVHVY